MKRTLLRFLLLAFAFTASTGCKTCLDCEEGEPRGSLRFTNRSGVDCDLRMYITGPDGRTIEESTHATIASDSTHLLPYDAMDRRAPTTLPSVPCPSNESCAFAMLRFRSAPESCLVFSGAERNDVPDIRIPSDYEVAGQGLLEFTIFPAHRSAAVRCSDARYADSVGGQVRRYPDDLAGRRFRVREAQRFFQVIGPSARAGRQHGYNTFPGLFEALIDTDTRFALSRIYGDNACGFTITQQSSELMHSITLNQFKTRLQQIQPGSAYALDALFAHWASRT